MPTVKRTIREDLVYEIDGAKSAKWTIRADFGPVLDDDGTVEFPGVVAYVTPDSAGRVTAPTDAQCEAYVFAALPAKERKRFAKATVDGSFPTYLVVDAAQSGWRNTTGLGPIEAANERALQLAMERLAAIESAESKAEFVAALTGKEEPEEQEVLDPIEV